MVTLKLLVFPANTGRTVNFSVITVIVKTVLVNTKTTAPRPPKRGGFNPNHPVNLGAVLLVRKPTEPKQGQKL